MLSPVKHSSEIRTTKNILVRLVSHLFCSKCFNKSYLLCNHNINNINALTMVRTLCFVFTPGFVWCKHFVDMWNMLLIIPGVFLDEFVTPLLVFGPHLCHFTPLKIRP